MSTAAIVKSSNLAPEEREQMADEFARARWWSDHWDELCEVYPDQFVAMLNGEIIATDPDFWSLVAQLNTLGPRDRNVRTEFVSRAPAIATVFDR